MKIIIFGATGTIGRHLVEQALHQGHQVVAFSRHAKNVALEHPRLSLVSGDVFDDAAVDEAIRCQQGVLIALGSAKLTGKVRSAGTQNIVKAMERHGVRRLVCQTTLGMGESWGNLDFFWKYLMFSMLLRFVFRDHAVQESILRASTLDWIIVRPAAFNDEPATGQYQHGFLPTKKNLALKIPRVEVADFMLQQLCSDHYLHQSPGLSY